MRAATLWGALAIGVWSGAALAQQPNVGPGAAPGGTGGTAGLETPPIQPAAGISVTTEGQFDNGVATFTASEEETLLDVTLDPQIVISPVPHVGLLFGLAVDIGASGTTEETLNGIKEADGLTVSSYGLTAGLAAIF